MSTTKSYALWRLVRLDIAFTVDVLLAIVGLASFSSKQHHQSNFLNPRVKGQAGATRARDSNS